MIPATPRWNTHLVEQVFTTEDAQTVLQCHISPVHHDELLWSGYSSGNYSVRSCYKWLVRQTMHAVQQSRLWLYLSRLPTLPQVCMFGWRAAHEALSVGCRLAQVGANSVQCCLCGSVKETVSYALRDCPLVSSIFSEAGFQGIMTPGRYVQDQCRRRLPSTTCYLAIGVILRDSGGGVFVGQAILVPHSRHSGIVEALAIPHDVRLAVKMGLSAVTVERSKDPPLEHPLRVERERDESSGLQTWGVVSWPALVGMRDITGGATFARLGRGDFQLDSPLIVLASHVDYRDYIGLWFKAGLNAWVMKILCYPPLPVLPGSLLHHSRLVSDCQEGENKGKVLSNDFVVRKLENLGTVKGISAKKTVSGTATFTLWYGFNSNKCAFSVFVQNSSHQILGSQNFQLPADL
ncbi:Dynein light chain type 1 family protein [Hibiscus syriacus]|uniref:Dynein light chain type 1 family protein n=1 Tax=Hibiscus syriacus TaxID=106335 RepID=A0A6A3CSE3_HIBSY|nr:Dynein light chain type 1 family protein [Hibiscus syriacus]